MTKEQIKQYYKEIDDFANRCELIIWSDLEIAEYKRSR